MSPRIPPKAGRRDFVRKIGVGALAGAIGATSKSAGSAPENDAAGRGTGVQWRYSGRRYESVGLMDLVLQLEAGQKLADESLIKFGTVEPPNGGSGGRTMRDACMSAEACAVYYAMTGNERTLRALKSAVRTFREYRHKARGRRVPYERVAKPIPLDFETYPEKEPGTATIEYQMGSIHVGRNMMGMRAAAHVLKDRQLLDEAAEELRWWLDIPFAYDKDGHFFWGAIIVDENGKPVRNSHGYRINMSVSLATALWLIGNDLGDERMMRYGKEAIVKGLPPVQRKDGYFPYMLPDDGGRQDGYHTLTCQKMSLLLPYKEWREDEVFMTVFRRAVDNMRQRLYANGSGMMEAKPDTLPPWETTSDLALISARMRRYLGETDAMQYVHQPLRWLHWNSPSCVPFWPNDKHKGMRHLRTGSGYSHCFRRVMLTAWEGIHLRQKGIRDVEAAFVP